MGATGKNFVTSRAMEQLVSESLAGWKVGQIWSQRMQDWIKVYAGSRRRLRTCRRSALLHQCGLRGITGLSSGSLGWWSSMRGNPPLLPGPFGYLETIWQFLLVTAGGGCWYREAGMLPDVLHRTTSLHCPQQRTIQPKGQQGPG